jgi:formylglycine-generating enzyme required for sulfatase activity
MTQPIPRHRYQSVDNILKDLQKLTSSQPQSVANVAKVIQKSTYSQPQPVATVAKVIQPLPISAESPTNKAKSTSKQPQAQAIIKVLSPKSTKESASISIPSSPSQSTKLPKSFFSSFLTLDCGKGIILEMVKVEAGSFDMGSNDDYESEKPIHRVNLQEFLIGKYPVTQAQYQAVTGNNPSNFKAAQNPVEKVSWHDAMEFCQKLSQNTGRKVRLPSEAEWEYAAKGGNQSKGYEYAGSYNLDEVGWYCGNSGGQTHPVGQKKANEIGIYDMSGNVMEWNEDVWHNDYKGKRVPTDGSAWLVGGNQNRRIWRGGSWFGFADACRSAHRYRGGSVSRHNCLGFRVVI